MSATKEWTPPEPTIPELLARIEDLERRMSRFDQMLVFFKNGSLIPAIHQVPAFAEIDDRKR